MFISDEKIRKEDNDYENISSKSKLAYAKLDFILSRQAINCSPQTINWYRNILGKIICWFENHEVYTPEHITTQHIRSILGEMAAKSYSDTYIHSYARVLKTFTRFLLEEEYIQDPIHIPMPKLLKKKKHIYTEEEVKKFIQVCKDKRDRAFLLLMIDSGLRRAEVIALNWSDVDISSGVVRVEKGKGGRARSVVIGIQTRRALIKYRSEMNPQYEQPVFQTRFGKRFTPSGLRSWMLRISKRAGINITPHALRRTFATLSIKNGMGLVHLQGLMGHASITTTRDYIGISEEDLVNAHKKHGPVDKMLI